MFTGGWLVFLTPGLTTVNDLTSPLHTITGKHHLHKNKRLVLYCKARSCKHFTQQICLTPETTSFCLYCLGTKKPCRDSHVTFSLKTVDLLSRTLYYCTALLTAISASFTAQSRYALGKKYKHKHADRLKDYDPCLPVNATD